MVKDYENMTDTEIQAEMILEFKAEKTTEKSNDEKKAFYDARDVAFKALNDEHTVAKEALASTWQAGEDNNLTIPK